MAVDELDALDTDLDNYRSLEDYPGADRVISNLCDESKQWVTVVNSEREAVQILGREDCILPVRPRDQ